MTSKTKTSKLRGHRYGANRNELATKKKKIDRNFSQSKDIREDRSVRQRTTGHSRTGR